MADDKIVTVFRYHGKAMVIPNDIGDKKDVKTGDVVTFVNTVGHWITIEFGNDLFDGLKSDGAGLYTYDIADGDTWQATAKTSTKGDWYRVTWNSGNDKIGKHNPGHSLKGALGILIAPGDDPHIIIG
jgi:hypothetical protein